MSNDFHLRCLDGGAQISSPLQQNKEKIKTRSAPLFLFVYLNVGACSVLDLMQSVEKAGGKNLAFTLRFLTIALEPPSL